MKISKKLKYLIYSVLFVLVVLALLLVLLLKLLFFGIQNRGEGEICLTDVKLGVINQLWNENVQLDNRESIMFYDLISFSEQLSVTYHHGKCTSSNEPINLSCRLDRKGVDLCSIYLYSDDKFLNCEECYH